MEEKQGKLGFGLISIIIVVAVIGLLAGGGLYANKKIREKQLLGEAHERDHKAVQVLMGISTWKTYRNEKYGFGVKYPSDWTLEEKHDYPPYDRFYINGPTSGSSGPIVLIAPIGWPAGELPGGKFIKKVGIIDGRKFEVTDFLTEDNAIWHQFMRFSEYGAQWTKENYLITDIRGGVKAICDVPITPTHPECGLGDPFKYLGVVDSKDRQTIDQILSTFKFIPLEK